jgi:MYXO-CTERM domain-containing protein
VGLCTGLLAAGAGCSPATEPAPGDLTASVQAAATVSPEVIVAEPVQQPALGRWPAAAFSGTQYLVVWEDLRNERPILYGARVAADGTTLDGVGFELLDALPGAENLNRFDAAVASDGEDFLVVTEAEEHLLGVRVSQHGEVLDPDGFVIAPLGPYGTRAALAFDGEQYLVAWTRQPEVVRDDADLYWVRVTPDGTVLDPGGVHGFALQRSSEVGVSFDGTNHLLSWVDSDPTTERPAVYAVRIGTDGAVIDAAPFRITPSDMGASPWTSPASAFDGTNHVIVWQSSFQDEQGLGHLSVRATRVSPQGTVLDANGVEVYGGLDFETGYVHRLAISAASGRSTVLTARDYSDPKVGSLGARLTVSQIAADGTVTAHPADNLAEYTMEATVAAHAAGALLLWRDGDDLYDDASRILGARLDAAGRPVAGAPRALVSSASSQEVRGVASDGQIFFVVWSDTREPRVDGKALYGARIAADGTPLDPEAIELTTERADVVDVVYDGADFVVTWVRHTGGEGDGSPFRFLRVSPEGAVSDATPEEPLLGSSYYTIASASDGTHTLLVGDPRSAESTLGAVLVDQQGAPVSEVAAIIAREPGKPPYDSYSVSEPAASFDGTGYLVVWHDGVEVLGQRVSATGALVGGHIPIVTGQAVYRSTVRSGGGNHLVVWQGDDGIFATRVTPDGQVLDPGGRLIAAVEPMCDSRGWCCGRGAAIPTGPCPSVSFDGTSFLVAWRAPAVPGDTTTLDLHGAELSPDGEVLETFTISDAPEREGAPFLAASAYGHVLAAFSRFIPGAPYHTRQVRVRFLTEGSPIPGPPDAGPIGPDAGPPGPTPDAGGSPADPLPGDGGGCGCTAGAAQPTPVAPLLLLGGVVGLWLVRRRRGLSPPDQAR